MKPRQKASPAALDLIKTFEGLRTRAAQAPDGRWTLGYGHTRSAREGAEVDAADAEALLLYDLRTVSAAVNAWTFAPLSQNQFDALCAFAFNVGLPAFRTSNVLRRVNEGTPLQAASAFDSWRKAEFEGEPQVIDALVRRRAAEKALFLTPAQGFVPAPTPVLPPRMDYAVGVLDEEPLELHAPLDGDPAPVRADALSAGVEEAQPSATAAAADTVSRRLRDLFPEEPTPEPQSPAEADPAPEAVPPALLDTDDLAPDPARQLAPPSPVGDPPALADIPVDAPVEPGPERWPYVFLFLGGVVLFVAGVTAFMRPDGGAWLGWLLGIAGVACIGLSAYFLLRRIDAED